MWSAGHILRLPVAFAVIIGETRPLPVISKFYSARHHADIGHFLTHLSVIRRKVNRVRVYLFNFFNAKIEGVRLELHILVGGRAHTPLQFQQLKNFD